MWKRGLYCCPAVWFCLTAALNPPSVLYLEERSRFIAYQWQKLDTCTFHDICLEYDHGFFHSCGLACKDFIFLGAQWNWRNSVRKPKQKRNSSKRLKRWKSIRTQWAHDDTEKQSAFVSSACKSTQTKPWHHVYVLINHTINSDDGKWFCIMDWCEY